MSQMTSKIFVVDDDTKFSKSLERLVKSIGFEVETYTSAEEFLERRPYEGPSCLLLDVQMPGLTGPVLQRELANRNSNLPVIFLTAHADVPTGIKAMKEGAIDFLLKPVEEKKLFAAIDKALDKQMQLKKEQEEIDQINGLMASLTPREYEIVRWVITGMLNKQIASRTNISERTVKAHRSQVMKKLHIVSVAELVRLTQKVNITPIKESPTP
ncbi:MAG: response regulator transcription factor [Planctomycetota bacterium]|jgi:FixJ family two-component response regulator